MNEPPMDSESHYVSIDDEHEPRTSYAPDGVVRQVSPEDADEALRAWGLSATVIESAIRSGYDALNGAPKTLPLWYRRGTPAAYITSKLLEELGTRGWTAFPYGQNVGASSPDGALGLLVWPGNEATGISDRRAKNLRAKGLDTRELFDLDSPALELPIELGPASRAVDCLDDDIVSEDDVEVSAKRIPIPHPDNWLVVLRSRIRGTRRVRAEVQLVARNSISSDGYLTRALVRVLLNDIELDHLPLENALTPAAVADPDVEVSLIDAPEGDKE